MAEISVKDLAYLQDCEKRDEKVAKLMKLFAYSCAPGDEQDLILVDELRKIYPFEEEL